MIAWTDKSYTAALDASNELLRSAAGLNEALGAGGGATSPEAVLSCLRNIVSMAESMKSLIQK